MFMCGLDLSCALLDSPGAGRGEQSQVAVKLAAGDGGQEASGTPCDRHWLDSLLTGVFSSRRPGWGHLASDGDVCCMDAKKLPTLDDIYAARERIRSHVTNTPLLESFTLGQLCGRG